MSAPAPTVPPLEQLLQHLRDMHQQMDPLYMPELHNKLGRSLALLRFEIRQQLVAGQARACDDIGLPMVMPPSGVCYRCGTDLLADAHVGRPQQPITGCPRCHVSYCD